MLDKGDAERENWAGLATESSELKLSQERMLTKTHLYEMVCRSVRGKEMSVIGNNIRYIEVARGPEKIIGFAYFLYFSKTISHKGIKSITLFKRIQKLP